jgi:hypothetical protein
MVEAASYVVYGSNGQFFARNGTTGQNDFSDVDATVVMQSALNNTCSQGSVFLKKTTSPSSYSVPDGWNQDIDFKVMETLYVPVGISVYSDGATVDATEVNGVALSLNANANDTYYSSSKGWVISGVTIFGGNTNANGVGIRVYDYMGVVIISNIQVFDEFIGIQVEGRCYRTTIQDSWIHFSSATPREEGTIGVEICRGVSTGDPNGLSLNHLDIGNYDCAIYQIHGTNVIITDCWIEGNTVGIQPSSAYIAGCYIQPYDNGYGIYGHVGGQRISGCHFVLGANCAGVYNTQDYAVPIIESTLFDLTGVNAVGVFGGPGTRVSPLISNSRTWTASTNNSLVGGFVQYAVVQGCYLAGNPALNLSQSGICSYNKVVGNTFYYATTGIRLGGSYNLIDGNVFDHGTTNILQTAGGSNLITDNIFASSTAISIVGGSAPIYDSNTGYVTENKGTATITTSTSIAFNHGLATTPTLVLASFNLASYGNYTWTATTTQITITVSTSGTYTVYWYAEV